MNEKDGTVYSVLCHVQSTEYSVVIIEMGLAGCRCNVDGGSRCPDVQISGPSLAYQA